MTLSHADAASKHGAWTYEEDKLLAKYQEIHGNRWSLVAVNIPGRTGQQCAQRWRHKVNPDIRKEKWTADEDKLLATLVAEHGNRWADIARHMPGRTDQQCMGRWRRHLDPNIRKCQWQTHEDELLKQQYEALGPQWSNISKFLHGRTAQQCRARWFQLCPASAAPPVPRTARNQNGRRDRHHDGASIQESARQLVAQQSQEQGLHTPVPVKAPEPKAKSEPATNTAPPKLTWEGTRTRTRSTKPRKRYSPILRSRSPAVEETECETPRAVRSDSMKLIEEEALEAAAALTEMAGGPRVHPSASPSSVRAPDQPLLGSPGPWLSPNKDMACCTPAKRPAAAPLWDGPCSSKHSCPGLLEPTPQQTPSHLQMHTPLLQHLAASPGFGASPLPANQDLVAMMMTPGSRNMLRSMPLDPVDKIDLPGDFSPGGIKQSDSARALHDDPAASQSMPETAENNSRDAQQRVASAARPCESPQLGVQTLLPAVERESGRASGLGYSVSGIAVSLSPPGSSGGGDQNRNTKGKLSPSARCDSDSVFPALEQGSCHRQQQSESGNADCSVHVNVNVNAKSVSNNSSTGKSSGVSSIDGLDRLVARHDRSAADASVLAYSRSQCDGVVKCEDGDISIDDAQKSADDGSYSIRQKLHSLVDDVFAVV